jgi:hypothetical protein
MPSDEVRFCKKSLISRVATNSQPYHAYGMSCLQCELPELPEASRPPDSELLDLIEQAFLDGQFDTQEVQ